VGAKSDAADAHLLAEIVRLDRAHHRPIAGDLSLAEAVKLTARVHQSLIWDRSRHVLRLRAALREFFPAALQVFADLDAPDALELLGRAPDPSRAAALSRAKITAALTRASRRDTAAKAQQIQAALRAPRLQQPPAVQGAYAAIVSSQVALITALNAQIEELGEVVATHFGHHPDTDLAVGERVDGPIFLAPDRQRLDRHGAARIVRRVAIRAGISKPVGPHTLRYAFITTALDAGVPLRDVQEAASHADPRTTMRYDRARGSPGRHATYVAAAGLAGAAR